MRPTDRPPEPLAGAAGFRFAIIVSRFNEAITERLREGARGAVEEAGASPGDVDVMVCRGLSTFRSGRCYAAESVVRRDCLLGCVIRGAKPRNSKHLGGRAQGIRARVSPKGNNDAFAYSQRNTGTAEERSASRK